MIGRDAVPVAAGDEGTAAGVPPCPFCGEPRRLVAVANGEEVWDCPNPCMETWTRRVTTNPAPRPGPDGGQATVPDAAELRRLLEAGTPGPWEAHPILSDYGCIAGSRVEYGSPGVVPYLSADIWGNRSQQDAALIVAAVNALPALLDRLEVAEAALADDAVERLSAAVHEGWMAHQRAAGYQSSRSKADGEEFMVPYADLSEGAKEIDRATVRAVLAAQRAALAGAGEGARP